MATRHSADNPEPLEDLSFNDGEMKVEFWEGNDLTAPWVRFYVKTFEHKYDSYWDEENEIIGNHILHGRDAMIKLRDYLNAAIDKSEGWVYRGTIDIKKGRP